MSAVLTVVDYVERITEQVRILSQLFPRIGLADEKLAEGSLPPNAKGWFAIPRWEKIAPTYPKAVQRILDLIEKTRRGKFHNYRVGQINDKHLRQSAKTAEMLQIIADQQKDLDILVVPCQSGFLYRDHSVCRALEIMDAKEFGLGVFAIGIMLLTHPRRLQCRRDLFINCAGDEFSNVGDDRFGNAPFFDFDDEEVRFGAHFVGSAGKDFGSASGFVPQ